MPSHLISYYNEVTHVLLTMCIHCGAMKEQVVSAEEADSELVEVDLTHKRLCPIILSKYNGKEPN